MRPAMPPSTPSRAPRRDRALVSCRNSPSNWVPSIHVLLVGSGPVPGVQSDEESVVAQGEDSPSLATETEAPRAGSDGTPPSRCLPVLPLECRRRLPAAKRDAAPGRAIVILVAVGSRSARPRTRGIGEPHVAD